MFDYFTKPKSYQQSGSSNSNKIKNEVSNDELPKFKELLDYIGIVTKDKSKLFNEIKLLTKEEKEFIEIKSVELLNIDKEITDDKNINDPQNLDNNLYATLKKLQFNVLSLFLLSKIKNPDCSEEIKNIINKFNTKIMNINEIVERNLQRDLPSTVQQSNSKLPIQPSQPNIPTKPTKQISQNKMIPPGSSTSFNVKGKR
jgi:hypothetical protein